MKRLSFLFFMMMVLGFSTTAWAQTYLSKSLRFWKTYGRMDYKQVVADYGYPVIGSGGQFAYASDYMHDGEVVFFGRKGTIDKPLHFKGKFWAVDTMFYAIPKKIYGKFLYYVGLTIPYKYYSIFAEAASLHHENINGSGYPEGLRTAEIPQLARIIHAVESYVSLVNRRSYHKILSKKDAVAELRRQPGIYDLDVIDILETLI